MGSPIDSSRTLDSDKKAKKGSGLFSHYFTVWCHIYIKQCFKFRYRVFNTNASCYPKLSGDIYVSLPAVFSAEIHGYPAGNIFLTVSPH